MSSRQYLERRSQLEVYFDRTAVEAWSRLTSDAPVSRIRATVRAGRNAMRETLLGWLPVDLRDKRVLDAGCGTGAAAAALAERGARVVAVDLSPRLVTLAQERVPQQSLAGDIEFRTGDFSDPSLGTFDYVLAMDSLIHYPPADVATVLAGLAARTRCGVVFTFAPATPLLAVMHATGRLFPRADRAPAIVPVGERDLRRRLADTAGLAGWECGRDRRIASGFYTSHAQEIVRR